jgi:hypothetical protein
MSERLQLLQDFHGHVGKPRQRGVVGQEQAAAVFCGRGEMKGVERFEAVGGTDSRSPFADGGP